MALLATSNSANLASSLTLFVKYLNVRTVRSIKNNVHQIINLVKFFNVIKLLLRNGFSINLYEKTEIIKEKKIIKNFNFKSIS
jgi:hypothetical protein